MQSPENWRPLFHARLAAERSHLLSQYSRLSEHDLTSQPVFDNYSAKDLLAHISEWDIFHTARMQHILRGRNDLIYEIHGETFYPEKNADLHQTNQHLTIAQSIEMLNTSRAGFLEALSEVSDDELHTTRTLPWGEEIVLADYVEWRYKHDALHSQSLKAWCDQLDFAGGPQPKVIMRAQFEASFQEVETLVALIPREERESRKVTGSWNLRDVIGHLADWETLAAEYISRFLNDLPTAKIEPWADLSGDEWNAHFSSARMGQPFDKAWQEYKTIREETFTLLTAITPEQLTQKLVPPWGGEIELAEFFLIWPDHDREHATFLRNEYPLDGYPEYLLPDTN
jgi:hypothetical protein